MYIVRCAQSRTALAAPSKNGMKNWKALARATATSREIDCEAIGGWGGWKMSARGWAGEKSRLSEQPAGIFLKKSGTCRHPAFLCTQVVCQQPVKTTCQKRLSVPYLVFGTLPS
jgi:hypothetical protein